MTQIKNKCPYCGLEQMFELPKDKGLDVCDDMDCNRPIDVLPDGSVKKSMLNKAEPESVTYKLPVRGFSWPNAITTGDLK